MWWIIYIYILGRGTPQFISPASEKTFCPKRFCPGDSYAHELLSITHEIYKVSDANSSLEMRRFFLYLTKAFDRVWHKGLMYKLTCLEVCGKYYGLIQSCLSNRFQRVALNKESSNWCHIKAGIPQGSILGPLFF